MFSCGISPRRSKRSSDQEETPDGLSKTLTTSGTPLLCRCLFQPSAGSTASSVTCTFFMDSSHKYFVVEACLLHHRLQCCDNHLHVICRIPRRCRHRSTASYVCTYLHPFTLVPLVSIPFEHWLPQYNNHALKHHHILSSSRPGPSCIQRRMRRAILRRSSTSIASPASHRTYRGLSSSHYPLSGL
ncbi:hypothetical protein BDR03DRAFT_954724 [Suillus americanus]|nr:hypothetical protein BDR03DRAFT_954724 [Suillus americanus]